MSQSHIDYILADYSVGLDQDQLPVTLSDLGLQKADVVALPAEFDFLPAGTYCPWVDVPAWVRTVGVHVQGNQACIAHDNGMALVCWLLAR